MPQQELTFWLSPSAKQYQKPCSRSSPVYQDLGTCHDWSVTKALGYFMPIRLKGNLKCISGNSLSPLVAQNKDIGAALQTLLTRV